jgi:hypothetical protein
MFKPVVTARIFNHSNHFSLSLPLFFQVLSRDIRDDLLEHFKDHKGRWNPATKMWDFEPHAKIAIFNILKGFNIQMTMPGLAEAEQLEKLRGNTLVEPARVLVQVPVDLVGPTNPAVQKILQTQYAKLEAEFRKLHMETGVCKTKMREILQNSVPSMLSMPKSNLAA